MENVVFLACQLKNFSETAYLGTSNINVIQGGTNQNIRPTQTNMSLVNFSYGYTASGLPYYKTNFSGLSLNGHKCYTVIPYEFTVSGYYGLSNTYWTNGYENSKISIMYSMPGTTAYVNEAQYMLDLDTGQKDQQNKEIFNKTNKYIDVKITGGSNNRIQVWKYTNGSLEQLADTHVGRWSAFIITVDLLKGTVEFTGCYWGRDAGDFTSYNTVSSETIVSDLGLTDSYAVSTIRHRPTSTMGYMQVTNTDVFLNTYNVVMTDPSFNVRAYWPDLQDPVVSVRSVALYGDAMHISALKTGGVWRYNFPVTDGTITIPYIVDSSERNIYSTDSAAAQKEMTLTNFIVQFFNGSAKITFLDNEISGNRFEFYILDANMDTTIGFDGLWYFTASVQEMTFKDVNTYDLKLWNGITASNQALILLYVGCIIVGGIIGKAKFSMGAIDLMIISVAGIAGATLLEVMI